MSKTLSIAGKAKWLENPDLQLLLNVLNQGTGEARVVGGAVRNTLLGLSGSDIDIATTHVPEEVISLAKAASLKTVATGIEHGTVTIVINATPYEVTTLRTDIETDGRHAKVAFGTDWKMDAERRDFTINALYADADGNIYDYVDGLKDIESRTLRFIGDAEQRIREDYLRILRFFRFFAWYGHGRPETQGLKAAARLKNGLKNLSAERVWGELKKLLNAPDPARALLWMRQSGVLTEILPESEKWGIDAIHTLIQTEKDLHWPVDALLRLISVVPPDADRMEILAKRLKISNAEKKRLVKWAQTEPVSADLSSFALQKLLYESDKEAIIDRIKLAYSAKRGAAVDDDQAMIAAGKYAALLKTAEEWVSPIFPLSGTDLMKLGFVKGPELGQELKRLETKWLDSGFSLSKDELLSDKIK